MSKTLKFARSQAEFFPMLNKRVNAYFTSNEIERTANTEMVIKTIFMFTLYFTPYVFIVSGMFTSLWVFLGLCIVMGLGKAGIGLSVMHDANHGSYSSKGWVNSILGFSMNLIGGNSFNWIVQHNVLHHTYTNVHEVDEDISPRGVLRMAPDSVWKSFHRFELGTNCRAWLFKILFHVIHHHRRKWFNISLFKEGDDFLEETLVYESPVPQSLNDEEVLRAMDKIPLAYREVVLLADVEDLAYKEIADVMSIPVGTVMSRLSRGRKLLRKELADYAEGYGIKTAGAKVGKS